MKVRITDIVLFFVLSAFCFLLYAGVLYAGVSSAQAARKESGEQKIQQGIAKQVVRLHVLANSDSDADQKLKLMVRDRVLECAKIFLQDADSADETKAEILENLDALKKAAEDEIQKQGYAYPVKVKLENCYFPMKSYGDCTFPAGNYDALRVCIGKAEGRNWWCVLYPNLCFVDCIHAVVPEKEKQELKHVLTEEEYDSLFDWKKDPYQIKSGIWEIVKGWLGVN